VAARPSSTAVRGGRAPANEARTGSAAGLGDRVALQELRHASGDGFGALEVQEMADPLDYELLDLRE
jgi:hypothetical protein